MAGLVGGEDDADTRARIDAYEKANGPISDAQLIEAIAAVLTARARGERGLSSMAPA